MRLPTAMKILTSSENSGYGRQPIPTSRDQEITGLLESFGIADLASQVKDEHLAVLRAFAERMASQAVRSKDPAILRLGLTALGLAGMAVESKDALTILPLYYHAAGRIGIVPHGLFRSVGSVLGGPAESVLERFLGRSDEDKSLEAMGYVVSTDEQGFRYERTW